MAGTILADIGGGTTDISVFKDGKYLAYRSRTRGRYQMTGTSHRLRPAF